MGLRTLPGSTRKILVVVTEAHIKAGRPISPCLCPIALALKDAWGSDPMFSMGVGRLTANITGWSADIPGSARDFIDRFDRGDRVQPFSFDMTFRRWT